MSYRDATRGQITNSKLGVFRRSRLEYFAVYEAETQPERPPTPALTFGTLLHMAILEPDKFESTTVVKPKFDLRKTIDKKAEAEWSAENRGKLAVSIEDNRLAVAMRKAAQDNPISRAMLAREGLTEHRIKWFDDGTGWECSAGLEKLTKGGGAPLILDLKSTKESTPQGFARACASYGYHRQCAMYMTGHRAVFGEYPKFVFLVIRKEPPFDVSLFELNADATDLGMRQVRRLLDQMAQCKATGNWYAPHQLQLNELQLPPWAFSEDEWEVSDGEAQ